MELQLWVGRVRILVDVVDPLRVEQGGPALDPVDFVPLGEEKFRKVRTVLPGHACDQRGFHARASTVAEFLAGRCQFWPEPASVAHLLVLTVRYCSGIREMQTILHNVGLGQSRLPCFRP